RRDFVQRRVFKKGAPDRPAASEFPSLDKRVRLLFELGFAAEFANGDEERGLALSVHTLMELERHFLGQRPESSDTPALVRRWQEIREGLAATPAGRDAFATSLLFKGAPEEEVKAVRALLS